MGLYFHHPACLEHDPRADPPDPRAVRLVWSLINGLNHSTEAGEDQRP
jgi:hypothetical protein